MTALRDRGGRALRCVATLALAGAVSAILAACTPPPGPAGAGLPDGVSVRFIQQRSDVALRQAQVEITNATDEVLVVDDLLVSDERFAADAERVLDRPSRIAPGVTVGIRIQLPDPDCGAPDDGESRVSFAYETGDGRREAVAPLPDVLDVVPGLHARECLEEALGAVAAVTIAGFGADAETGPGMLRLRVEPTGAGGAALRAIRPTNLLGFGNADPDGTAALGVALTPGDRAVREIAIPIEPFRCDAHAVQEDKRGTIFTLDVVVGERSGQIQLAADPDLRATMLSWVAQRCGFA